MKKKKSVTLHERFYLVLSKESNYTHGAFPFSKEGLKSARSLVKTKSTREEKLYIVKK